MASKRKRVDLSLKEKIAVIKASEEADSSQRKLAERFGVGKTQIQVILSKKQELLDAFKANGNLQRKRLCYRGTHEEIDDLTWRWFQRARGIWPPRVFFEAQWCHASK